MPIAAPTAAPLATMTAAVRKHLLELGRWSLLLCLFAIPITKAGTNIFIFLALLFSLLGIRTRQRFAGACKQPVVLGAGLWFGVLALSTLYAPVVSDALEALGAYKALLYPIIAASLLESPQWRTRGLLALALSACVVLLLSWAQFFNIVPVLKMASAGDAYRYTVFRDYTQQGLLFLVLAAMAASFAMIEPRTARKRLLWLLAAAAFFNVVFLLQSRTSYLVVVPLLLYWVWRASASRFSATRKAALGLTALAVLAAAAFAAEPVRERFQQVRQDFSAYERNRVPNSTGIRLELWKRTLPIVAAAPLFGHGLGQWQVQYRKQTEGLPFFSRFMMGHPHQEALSILSEVGFVGLAIFVLLLIALARYINRLDAPHRDFYRSVLLIYIVAGLGNCILLDFSHRHLFLMLLACIPLLPRASSPAETQA
ncbi:hypothetical protein BH11PSE11_BH11PSE11_00910 [soil metagenome]